MNTAEIAKWIIKKLQPENIGAIREKKLCVENQTISENKASNGTSTQFNQSDLGEFFIFLHTN